MSDEFAIGLICVSSLFFFAAIVVETWKSVLKEAKELECDDRECIQCDKKLTPKEGHVVRFS